MKYSKVSYSNKRKGITINVIIEPWLLMYDVPYQSTIEFYYTSTDCNHIVDIINLDESSISIYFDLIRVEIDQRDVTHLYPILKKFKELD